MALTLRTVKGSRLTHAELDGNFRHLTGSHEVSGSIIAVAFSGSHSGSFEGDGSGLTGVTAEWDGSHSGDADVTGSFVVSGSSAKVNFLDAELGVSGSFSGSFVGDGSGLTGIGAASLAGTGVISGSTQIAGLGADIISGSGLRYVPGQTMWFSDEYFTFKDYTVIVNNPSGFAVGDLLFGVSTGTTIDGGSAQFKAARNSSNAASSFNHIANFAFKDAAINIEGSNTTGIFRLVNTSTDTATVTMRPNNGHVSASLFSGSFVGDGSNLTGVTGEWDGTLNGDAEITGSLVVSSSDVTIQGPNFDVTVENSTHTATNEYEILTGGVSTAKFTDDGHVSASVYSGSIFSGSFVGDGSGLTGLPAVDLTGTTVISGSGLEWASNAYVAWNFTEGVDLNDRFAVYPNGTLVNNEAAKFTSANIGLQNSHMKFYQFGSNTNDIEINATRGHISASAFSGSFSGSFEGTLSNRLRLGSTVYSISSNGDANLRAADFQSGAAFNGTITSNDDVTHGIAPGEEFKVTAANLSSEIFRVNGDKEMVVKAAMTVSDFDVSTTASADFTGATGGVSGSFSGSFEGTISNLLRMGSTSYRIQSDGNANFRNLTAGNVTTFNGDVLSKADVNHSIASGEVFKVTRDDETSQIFRVNGDHEINIQAAMLIRDYNVNTTASADFTGATGGVSGSFSGSFEGDGSGLTGVTGEWDGTRNGDAEITGSLVVSGSGAELTSEANVNLSGAVNRIKIPSFADDTAAGAAGLETGDLYYNTGTSALALKS